MTRTHPDVLADLITIFRTLRPSPTPSLARLPKPLAPTDRRTRTNTTTCTDNTTTWTRSRLISRVERVDQSSTNSVKRPASFFLVDRFSSEQAGSLSRTVPLFPRFSRMDLTLPFDPIEGSVKDARPCLLTPNRLPVHLDIDPATKHPAGRDWQ